MSKKRVIWLVVGWVAAGFALYYVVGLLHFSWTWWSWSPEADVLSVSLLCAIPVLLAGLWFLAKRTHDRVSQIVSALVCLALAEGAMRAASWFPLLSPGERLWFERACSLVLCLPAGFWLWHLWLPDTTRAARSRIIAIITSVLILAGAAFNARYSRVLAEIAANSPKQKDPGDQIWAAFADALMKGGPAPKPGLRAWRQIRVGLSRKEVLAILGEPATKVKPNSSADAATKAEWWEYGYSAPFGASAADPRAYAIFFNSTGHVTSFQEPSEPSK